MSKFKPETKLILRAKKVSKQKISPKFKKRTKSPNVCCMFMHKSLLNYGIRYRAQCQFRHRAASFRVGGLKKNA